MALDLPFPTVLKDHAAAIVNDARNVMDGAGIAETPNNLKLAVVAAAMVRYKHLLHSLIHDALNEAVEMHEMLHGERDAGWSDADKLSWDLELSNSILNELTVLREFAGHERVSALIVDVRLHDPDLRDEAAGELARLFANGHAPETQNAGKWLASIGIAIGTETVQQPGAPVAAPNPVAFVAPPLVDAPPVSAAAIPPAPTAKPGKEAIARGYKLIYEDAAMVVDDMAKELGISRQTLLNWFTGRTQAKCTAAQGAFLRACCDKWVAALQEAATIFAAVRD